MTRGQLILAGNVRPGDLVLDEGSFRRIQAVRRAQGRKPKAGENLHLVAEDGVLKRNSTSPVRVRRTPVASG